MAPRAQGHWIQVGAGRMVIPTAGAAFHGRFLNV
jgi:hypothetical protein